MWVSGMGWRVLLGSQDDVFEVVQHSVQESESLEQMLQNILWDGRVCRDEYVCPYN